MASDIDGKAMPTTVGMADVDEASKFEGQMGSDGPNAPGAIAAGGTTSTLPDWYEVGWTGVAKGMRGFTGQAKDDDEAVRQDLMAQFLGDAYYGYFWWNGGM